MTTLSGLCQYILVYIKVSKQWYHLRTDGKKRYRDFIFNPLTMVFWKRGNNTYGVWALISVKALSSCLGDFPFTKHYS